MSLWFPIIFVKSYRRVAVEKSVIIFHSWKCPNMCKSVTQLFHVVQVSQKDLMVDTCPEVSGLEKVDSVQDINVNPSGVGGRTIRTIFLHKHTKETDVNAIDLLKG